MITYRIRLNKTIIYQNVFLTIHWTMAYKDYIDIIAEISRLYETVCTATAQAIWDIVTMGEPDKSRRI